MVILGKFLILFLVVFAVVYVVVNAPALYQKLSYWYITVFKKEAWPKSYQIAPIDLQNNLGYILAPQKKPSTNKNVKKPNQPEIDLDNNFLYIPKLGIKAPINWEISEGDAMAYLESGVVHLKGTGLPGTDGNIFITGHSSYYWWAAGGYKTIFSLLPNVQNGDLIYLTYADKLYIYQVVEELTVAPSDTWVMDKLDYPALSLMTCVPVGTNFQRFIVRAKQISPSTEAVKPKPHKQRLPKEVPELLPSIF